MRSGLKPPLIGVDAQGDSCRVARGDRASLLVDQVAFVDDRPVGDLDLRQRRDPCEHIGRKSERRALVRRRERVLAADDRIGVLERLGEDRVEALVIVSVKT